MNTIPSDVYGPIEVTDGILQALKTASVVTFKRVGCLVRVRERCDRYFDTHLTPDQLRQMASELLAMADDIDPPRTQAQP